MVFASLDELAVCAGQQRLEGRRVVATNGCFDMLHLGHLHILETAAERGDWLVVGVNSDASVRTLKGPKRPVNDEGLRSLLISKLKCVDAAVVFEDVRATRFLEAARPHVWVKGGDYTVETLDADEKSVVEENGGEIVIVPSYGAYSTTGVLERIQTEVCG